MLSSPTAESDTVVLHIHGDAASSSSHPPPPPPPHSRPPFTAASSTTATQQLPPQPKQVPRTNSSSKTPSRNSSNKSDHVIDMPSDPENKFLGSSDGAVLARNPSIRRRIQSRRPSDKREDEPAEVAEAPVAAAAEGEGERNLTDVGLNSGVKELPLLVISQIVKEADFRSLRELGGVEGVALALDSHLEHGVAHDSETSDWDTVGTVPLAKFFSYLWEACNRCTIILLFILAALSFVTGTIDEGIRKGWYDGTAILGAVFALITFPAAAKLIRERKRLGELLKKNKSPIYNVVRSGRQQSIAVSGLMAGDIVKLSEGDCIPADGLFVDGNDLVVDDMSISGFSRENNPFLFSGAKVQKGSGRMLITCVGKDTALGEALSVRDYDPHKMKLLLAHMERPNSYIENLALAFSIVVAIVMLTRLLWKKQTDDIDHPEIKGKPSAEQLMKILKSIFVAPRGRISMLTNSLAAVVIGFQHGMHLVICYSLIHWNKKAVSKIQDLFACVTMGLVSVVCVDTSCGQFCEQPEIKHFWIGDADMGDDNKSKIAPVVLEALERALGFLVLEPQDPIFEILSSWVKSRWNVAPETVKQNYVVLDLRRLISKKAGLSSGILMYKDGDERNNLHLHWKGSASSILGMCSHYFDYRGQILAPEEWRRTFEKVILDMENKGLRTIAYAYSPVEFSEMREDGLILLAIVGVKYSCDDASRLAVENIRLSGVKIKLLSDYGISSIRAIACGLGLLGPHTDDETLVNLDLQEFTPIVLTNELDQRTVVKGIRSEENLRVVEDLKSNDSVVAFVGGSMSNILALKEADVGISLESHSTKLARENSDIIIDGGISPIFRILSLGQCVYNNVQLFTQLQLVSCFSGLLITLVVAVCTGISPITSIQLIWVNLVTWILGGFMMIIELKRQKPGNSTQARANRKEPFVTKSMLIDIGLHVLCALVVFLIFEYMGHMVIAHLNNDLKRTMMFNAFIFCQVFNLLDAISVLRKDHLVSAFRVYGFWLALGGVIAAQVLVIQYLKNLANCVRLNALQWTACIVIATVPFILVRAIKFVYNSFQQSPLYIRLRSLSSKYSKRRLS